MLEVKQLDVVLLKDGREATVLEVFKEGTAYMVEVTDDQGIALEIPIIAEDDIEKITYHA
jgi:hypothetical protein